jgi:outer membrane protein assembly factor BamE (lipoprotein component of BamABCDE complex)
MQSRLVALASAIALSGCMASGVQVDQKAVAKFEKGKTTIAEVEGTLGAPTNSTISSEGTQTIMYNYVQMQMRPETFIPYVGAFVGGADTKNSFAMFNFDDRGVLVNYTSSSGQMGMGTNLESNTKMDDRVAVRPTQSGSGHPLTATPVQAQNAAPVSTFRRTCTQAEATQKRVAIENGYSMIPNCQ